jgi:hypothetical protein
MKQNSKLPRALVEAWRAALKAKREEFDEKVRLARNTWADRKQAALEAKYKADEKARLKFARANGADFVAKYVDEKNAAREFDRAIRCADYELELTLDDAKEDFSYEKHLRHEVVRLYLDCEERAVKDLLGLCSLNP